MQRGEMATFPPELRAIVGELGDQRAKELNDAADEEPDPRLRIKLLHSALRCGRHSIQATKAYQNLGSTYEDLGNVSRAIMYYTRAIELDEVLGIVPIPALYWRGQLLAQRGKRESAQRDFERALPLDVPSFFPEEREFAEQYLAEPT